MAKLKSTAKRYNDHRAKSHPLRDALDAEIVKARNEGKTYSEIADEIDLSVAWVQASLKRSGIVGQPKKQPSNT